MGQLTFDNKSDENGIYRDKPLGYLANLEFGMHVKTITGNPSSDCYAESVRVTSGGVHLRYSALGLHKNVVAVRVRRGQSCPI